MRKFSNEAVVGPNIGRDFLSQVGLGRTSDAVLHYAPNLRGTPLKAAREHANAASKDPALANAMRSIRLTNRAPLLAGGLSAITGAGGGAIAGGLGRMAGGGTFGEGAGAVAITGGAASGLSGLLSGSGLRDSTLTLGARGNKRRMAGMGISAAGQLGAFGSQWAAAHAAKNQAQNNPLAKTSAVLWDAF